MFPFQRFELMRINDVTGFSGTGKVAEGVQFSDGTCVVRWVVPNLPRSSVVWDSVADVSKVHGHDGNTVLRWTD